MNVGHIAARLIAFVIDGVDADFIKNTEIDHEELYQFAKAHSIGNIICIALKQLNIMPPQYESFYEKLYKILCAQEATQEIEKQEIVCELERLGIKHMLLKGSVMKHLYPSPELRSMCDIDILYDTAYISELNQMMLDRGYTLVEVTGSRGKNIAYVLSPFVRIEFHGVLMDRDIPRYNRYFGENFERTVPVCGTQVRFSDEDFFVFMVAHIAKHYFIGGTGIRSLADIWLFLRKKPDLDMDSVRSKLREIELEEFADIIIGVNGVLFDGNEPTPLQSEVIEYIFNSGTYGTVNNRAAENVKETSKFGYVLKRLFPDREFMSVNYPAVKKCVLLLPLFWLIRLVSVALKKGYKGSDIDLVMRLEASQIDARKIPGNPFEKENSQTRKEGTEDDKKS